ncbi:MAG: electron transfer flavoprotein subunit beta/FixA family protein [Acidimicrobiia bacterium]|nr:electron transfer flavoprotein subunit beta/FixA family protein [Acidimicrobiia bacterium]NNC76290.1 electron transfer flavoprotein subunit beta/FixA family protein [Acidimicrobiia bacterium]
MRIAVCAKQIPDPATPYELDPETHFVVRPEEQVLDDTDRYGIEVALQLADAAEGTVTLVSMGPAGSMQGIRQALAMGADKAIVIDDDGLRGSGALTTARVLAAAIEREGFDLVIAGTESTDGYTGVVPQQIAEILGVPALTFAKAFSHADGKLRIERQTEVGYDVVEAEPPALMTVTSGVVEPRYPTFKGIMQAKQKPVEQLTAADLGIDGAGPADAGQTIASVSQVPSREAGVKVEDDGEGHTHIVALLEERKVI